MWIFVYFSELNLNLRLYCCGHNVLWIEDAPKLLQGLYLWKYSIYHLWG